MKILGVTQGSNLKVFLSLTQYLEEKKIINRKSVFISDSKFYKKLLKDEPNLFSGSMSMLNEWEIINDALKIKPNWKFLTNWEKKIGNPFLWNAIIADRRIFFGKHCKYKQDYKSRFTHNEMNSIIQGFIYQINKFL